METDTGHEKQQLHSMVDLLAPEQVRPCGRWSEVMLDPVARAIANAPVDDDPLTPEDKAALDEAREWLKHNKSIPHEQVLAELCSNRPQANHRLLPARHTRPPCLYASTCSHVNVLY